MVLRVSKLAWQFESRVPNGVIHASSKRRRVFSPDAVSTAVTVKSAGL